MTIFEHKSPADRQYLAHFHADPGEGHVVLTWETRDGLPREAMVFRSREAFAQAGIDPRSDPRQTLVYQGTDRHGKVDDAAEDGPHCFYSVFARGDDGIWHIQLKTVASAEGRVRWHWPWQHEFDPEQPELVRCDVCGGTGCKLRADQTRLYMDKYGTKQCWKCQGKGWLEVKKGGDEADATL
jgi:hypothetical protein